MRAAVNARGSSRWTYAARVQRNWKRHAQHASRAVRQLGRRRPAVLAIVRLRASVRKANVAAVVLRFFHQWLTPLEMAIYAARSVMLAQGFVRAYQQISRARPTCSTAKARGRHRSLRDARGGRVLDASLKRTSTAASSRTRPRTRGGEMAVRAGGGARSRPSPPPPPRRYLEAVARARRRRHRAIRGADDPQAA